MHFFPFNIGDYGVATAHLDEMEDLAYRRLMDLYYSSEKPIPLDLNEVSRKVRMRTHSESIANVLREFFTEESDGYHSERIDIELFKFQEKSDKASKSAKVRWKKHKQKQKLKASSESNANALETHSDGIAKQELRTKKQEPSLKPIVAVSQQRKFSDGDLSFVDGMLNLLSITHPKLKQPNKNTWAETVRLMRERDGLTHEEMATVFTWANADSFWCNNILSPTKLRKQWDTLLANSTKPKVNGAASTEDWDDDNDWHNNLGM